MNNKLLPWQEGNWRQLYGYIRQNRLPQALLISGNKGIGKTALARHFAHSLLCLQSGPEGFCCGTCRYCSLLEAGSHPDFLEVTPEEEKKSITINQIRAVIGDTFLKPQYDQQRVVIIHPADTLTVPAANAFLKCLEEPAERTVFILLTEKPSKLPATIISRCQHIIAQPPTTELLCQWLKLNNIIDGRAQLLNLFKGALITHSQFLDESAFNCRSQCLNDWHGIAAQRYFPAAIAEKWEKLPKTDLINWMLSWVADIIRQKQSGDSGILYNRDMVDYSRKYSLELDLLLLYKLYDKLLAYAVQIEMQLNFQNMLEEILINWQEINRMESYGGSGT